MKSILQYTLSILIMGSFLFSCKPEIKDNESFYSLVDTTVEGKIFEFEQLRGKKVLIVNTASKSRLTKQLTSLGKLWDENYEKVTVIVYPTSDFDEQEFDYNQDIEDYLRLKYRLEFPIMQKSVVKKADKQSPVYQWLTDIRQNGILDQEPTWNFCKYLIDEKGYIIKYYDEYTIPLEIVKEL